MKQLSLFRRVIFVDWHGVLSQDPFWTSILKSSSHPLHAQLEVKIRNMISHKPTAHSWMKGRLSSQQVISEMGILMDRRFRQDFLSRRLDDDCARMRVNVQLLEVLRKFGTGALIVLATDNMDCFARTFKHAHKRKRPPSTESTTLAEWAMFCDDLICSSDIGALKAEDPLGFFGPWLSEHGMRFSNALLIDDRNDNCQAFREQGGCIIQWKLDINDLNEVVDSMKGWFRSPVV